MAIKKLIANNVKVTENGAVTGSVLIGPYTYNHLDEVENGEKSEAYFEVDFSGFSFDEVMFEAAQSPRVTNTNNFRQAAEIRENGKRQGVDGEVIERCERYRSAFPTRNGRPVIKVDAKNPASMELPMTPEQKRDALVSVPRLKKLYEAETEGMEEQEALQKAEELYAELESMLAR